MERTQRARPAGQVSDRRPRSVDAARDLSHHLLGDASERFEHSAAVAARAAELVRTVDPRQGSLLVAAAWLHDIGYAARLRDTGCHSIDGARFLRAAGWDPLLCDLVAHHSGSRFLAPYDGVQVDLAEFTFLECPLSDALTVADQTVGPYGRSVSLDERMRDMLRRHGPGSSHARAHPARAAYFLEAFRRVDLRLERAHEAGAHPRLHVLS